MNDSQRRELPSSRASLSPGFASPSSRRTFLRTASAPAVLAVLGITVDGSTIRAFTSICTHQQCMIDRFEDGVFTCPCHGSQYATSGEVIQGPAPRPLTEYSVARSGSTVTITR